MVVSMPIVIVVNPMCYRRSGMYMHCFAHNLLFFGNSLTAGYGLDVSEAFPALIQHKLDSLNLPYKVINAGLSGETSAGGKNRIDWLLRNKIDVFVLELGANDGLRGIPVAETVANLQDIIDRVKTKYPDAKLFGLTTSSAVMKINSELGYRPVTFSELTDDEDFWKGCSSCVNYDILMSKDRKNCLCTGMLYDPKDHYEPEETKEHFQEKSKVYERLLRFKQWRLLKALKRKSVEGKGGKPKSMLHYFFNF